MAPLAAIPSIPSLFLGTVHIDKSLSTLKRKHSPPFLQRNIQLSLDMKQRELDLRKNPPTNRHSPPLYDPKSLAIARDLDHWYPDVAMTKELVSRSERVLHVSPKEIRLRGAAPLRALASALDNDIPTWLPRPNTQVLHCKIRCSISHHDNNRQTSQFKSTLPAELHCTTLSSGKSSISIRVNEPFIIDRSAFSRCHDQLPKENKAETVGLANGHQTLSQYRIRFAIEGASPTATSDLYQSLGLKIKEANLRDPALYGRLSNLDDFGNVETHIDLSAEIQNASRRIGYDLVLDMNWQQPDSIMEIVTKDRRFAKRLELGMNSAMAGNDASGKTYQLTYRFTAADDVTRTCIVGDLSCQFCASRRAHSSFDRLRLHYALHHPHFKVSLDQPKELDGIEHRLLKVDIDIKGGKRLRASNDVLDEREMHWIRPVRPFDLRRFLRGDESWVDGYGSKRLRMDSPTGERCTDLPIGTWGPKDPENVPPARTRKRKRFQVPDIPGTVFLRLVSKRQVNPGELLSESEDESTDSESWAAQKQRLRKQPFQGSSNGDFCKLFDTHIHKERLRCDMHMSDAVVRFTRKHKDQLRRLPIQADFRLKLRQLLLSEMIQQKVHDYCLDQIRPPQTTNGHTVNGHVMDGHATNGHATTTNGHKKNGLTNGDLAHARELPENMHPLAQHPVVRRVLGPWALHPKIHGRIFEFLDDPDVRRECCRLATSMGDKIRDDAHFEAEMAAWVEELRRAKPVPAANEHACVCGATAIGPKGSIRCANMHCFRSDFHLCCVNLETYDEAWQCGTCAGREHDWVE